MNKPTIYLCGPMSGIKDLNEHEFKVAHSRLLAIGFHPVNPHLLNNIFGGSYANGTRDKKMTIIHDIVTVLDVDFIFTLEGVSRSAGGRAECAVFEWMHGEATSKLITNYDDAQREYDAWVKVDQLG